MSLVAMASHASTIHAVQRASETYRRHRTNYIPRWLLALQSCLLGLLSVHPIRARESMRTPINACANSLHLLYAHTLPARFGALFPLCTDVLVPLRNLTKSQAACGVAQKYQNLHQRSTVN